MDAAARDGDEAERGQEIGFGTGCREANMKNLFFVVPLVLLFCFTLGCQQKGTAPIDPVAARELCTRLLTDYIETVKTLEPNKVAAWFAKDAVLIYPDMAELKSRDNIQAFFIKAFPGVKVLEMTFTLIHCDVVGSKAYTFFTINELEQAGGQPPVRALARCGIVWQRQADNSWQILHFLVNYLQAK
jgi:ketosteroid isomerase-like protein